MPTRRGLGWRFMVLGAAMALIVLAAEPARANPLLHVTDGFFTSPDEWSGPTVNTTFFPYNPATNAGGAYLYVEQGFNQIAPSAVALPDTLYLMYDYVFSNEAGFSAISSFYDVFFELPQLEEDYLVRMSSAGIIAVLEKDSGEVSSLNPDGSFNIEDPVWSPVGSEELALSRFQAAIGFGTSPNSDTPHLMAEFQLSINTEAFEGGTEPPTGIYDPDPAFWSASVGKPGDDPPISSAIFTLNPDGSTIVQPALGPNGDPVQQPQQVTQIVPEPATWALACLAGLGLVATVRRRRAA